jgi:hypothetical protein
MTRMPQVGAIFLLQQQLVTGAQTTHLYQTPQAVGSLTIRAVQGMALSLTTSSQQGTFDLRTGLFHFSPRSSLGGACARCAWSADRQVHQQLPQLLLAFAPEQTKSGCERMSWTRLWRGLPQRRSSCSKASLVPG